MSDWVLNDTNTAKVLTDCGKEAGYKLNSTGTGTYKLVKSNQHGQICCYKTENSTDWQHIGCNLDFIRKASVADPDLDWITKMNVVFYSGGLKTPPRARKFFL
jgi:hypothetical protein